MVVSHERAVSDRVGDDRDSFWELLVGTYRPQVERYVRSRGVLDPEDVTQEVMAAAVARADELSKDVSRLESWLFTVAYRRIADAHRRRYRAGVSPLGATDVVDRESGPAVTVCLGETMSEIATALSTLSPRERAVVTMRVFDELPAAEVAAMLHLTPSHVRVIQTRAMVKMRAALPDSSYSALRSRVGVVASIAATIRSALHKAGRIPDGVVEGARTLVAAGTVAAAASVGGLAMFTDTTPGVAGVGTDAASEPSVPTMAVAEGGGGVSTVAETSEGAIAQPDTPPATGPVIEPPEPPASDPEEVPEQPSTPTAVAETVPDPPDPDVGGEDRSGGDARDEGIQAEVTVPALDMDATVELAESGASVGVGVGSAEVDVSAGTSGVSASADAGIADAGASIGVGEVEVEAGVGDAVDVGIGLGADDDDEDPDDDDDDGLVEDVTDDVTDPIGDLVGGLFGG